MLDSVFFFFFFLLTCSRTTPWAHSIWKSNELVVAQILFSSFFFSLAPVLFSIFAVLLLHLVVVLTAVLI